MISAQVGGRAAAVLPLPVHKLLLTLTVALAITAISQHGSAQSLTSSLIQRYLEALREQAGIPGMSAFVLHEGREVWSGGFGRADLDAAVPATLDTPYQIGGLSQVLGATLLLKECVEEQALPLGERIARWIPFADPLATPGQLLAHLTGGAFRYDLDRFAMLTPLIEECAGRPYEQVLDDEVLTRFGMWRTVPGTALATPSAGDVEAFGAPAVQRYTAVLGDAARPYRLDGRRAVRTELPPGRVNAATGLVTTARDLGAFEAALFTPALLDPATLQYAWRRPAPHLPAGLGWFVQTYNGELVVWQFGQVKDAYSALYVKVPSRGLAFILLANSDTLAAPFTREMWDVTASLFARTFLLIYVP